MFKSIIDIEYITGIIISNGEEFEVKLKNKKENIASFIQRCPCNARVMLVDIFDCPILSTIGKFLDKCNQEYREWLIDTLVSMQKNEELVQDIEFSMDLYLDEYTPDDIINYVKENLNYNLVGEISY